MSRHIKHGSKARPSIEKDIFGKRSVKNGEASADLEIGTLVKTAGWENRQVVVKNTDPSAPTWAVYVMAQAAPNSQPNEGTVVDWIVLDFDTSAGAVGDPVYMATADASTFNLTDNTNSKVGEVFEAATVANGGKVIIWGYKPA